MMLLLDVGNTSVKWAAREDAGMDPVGCFQYQNKDFNALAQAAWGDLQAPEKIVVSNVAGSDMGDRLAGWTLKHWGLAGDRQGLWRDKCLRKAGRFRR